MFRLLIVVVLGALIAWGVSVQRNPYRTALPLEVADLRPIQGKLDKLPAADRELVLGYLQRSRGDVLPAHLADPDEPLTARTFAEAIKLQRQFLERQAVITAQLKAQEAVRDEAMAPLRAALGIRLVKREIVARGELLGKPLFSSRRDGRLVAHAIDNHQVVVTTYRLENNSGYTSIAGVKANVRVRKQGSSRYDLGDLSSCYIAHDAPIPTGEGIDIRCANTNKQVSEADRAYVDLPVDDLVIDWEPKLIRFGDGKELAVKD